MLLGESSWINRHGDFRAREQYGLIARRQLSLRNVTSSRRSKVLRKAKCHSDRIWRGERSRPVNMIDLAPMIEKETGIDLRIVGFDTGQGLPSVQGYKDHPELWRAGDFATEDREALMRKLGGRAEIIWGDIADTIGPFTDSINSAAPLGFISVDLDIYSATTVALRCLTADPRSTILGLVCILMMLASFLQMSGLVSWRQFPNLTSSMNLERSGLTVVYRDADPQCRRIGIRKCTSAMCSITKSARILATGDNWQLAITQSTWQRGFFSDRNMYCAGQC